MSKSISKQPRFPPTDETDSSEPFTVFEMDFALRRRLQRFGDADDQLARIRSSDPPAEHLHHPLKLSKAEKIPLYVRKTVKSILSVLLTAICVVFNVCCATAASGQ